MLEYLTQKGEVCTDGRILGYAPGATSQVFSRWRTSRRPGQGWPTFQPAGKGRVWGHRGRSYRQPRGWPGSHFEADRMARGPQINANGNYGFVYHLHGSPPLRFHWSAPGPRPADHPGIPIGQPEQIFLVSLDALDLITVRIPDTRRTLITSETYTMTSSITLASGDRMPVVGLGLWKVPREICANLMQQAIR